jgi:hypothetical protein
MLYEMIDMLVQRDASIQYYEYFRDHVGTSCSLLCVERACKAIWIPTVAVQSDRDVQQCAELPFSLTGTDGCGFA